MSSTHEFNCNENNISNTSSSSFNTRTNAISAENNVALYEEPKPFLVDLERGESEAYLEEETNLHAMNQIQKPQGH